MKKNIIILTILGLFLSSIAFAKVGGFRLGDLWGATKDQQGNTEMYSSDSQGKGRVSISSNQATPEIVNMQLFVGEKTDPNIATKVDGNKRTWTNYRKNDGRIVSVTFMNTHLTTIYDIQTGRPDYSFRFADEGILFFDENNRLAGKVACPEGMSEDDMNIKKCVQCSTKKMCSKIEDFLKSMEDEEEEDDDDDDGWF